jgi:hypothetical protein
MEAVSDVFRGESIMPPNIRLSHPIKGRVNIPTHVDHLFRRMLTTDSDDVDHL